jgi:hypothetical protein
VNDVVSNAATNALSATTTVNGTFIFAVGGYKQYRIVMTAYTSGSATVAYDGGVGQNVSMTISLITDGTNGNVAVKPASTAAVATDPALVVAISPNNPLTISTANTVATGTLGSLNASVTLAMAGLNAAGFQLATGTLIGTIIAQCSIDNGVTWNTTSIDQATNGQKTASIVFASANTATAGHIVGIGGTTHVRVTVSLYTSGTANITITGSMMDDPTLISTGPAGTPNPPTTMFIGGTDGSNIRNLLTDTSGRQVVVGGAANAAAVAGNPVLISGWNATNAYTLLTDTSGRLNMVGAASAGSAVVGNPVLMGGSDGSNARTISTNSSGQVVMVGAGTASAASGGLITTQGPVATGTAIGSAGFPILMAGSDGANLRSLSTNTSGQLVVFGSGTAGTNYTTGVVTVQGSSTGTAIPISGAVSITGTVTVTESSIGSTGSAVPSFANMIGGTDGANLRALSTTSTGALNVTSANITATGALGSLNAAVSLAMAGAYYAGFQLAAGTLIGTIIAQCSIDGGVTWNTTSIDLTATGQKVSSVVFASSNTATAAHIVGLGGTTHVRVTVSAYTSGTANITITGSMMDDPTLVPTGPNGTAVPPTSFSIAGSDGTLLRNLLTDTTGRALVYSSDNTVTGTLASTTQTTAVPCAGAQSVSFQLSSSLVGTLVPLISFDGGTSYITGPGFYDPIKQAFLGQSLVINPAALQELTLIIPAGTSHARVNCSAFTSGSSTYFLRATTANAQPSFQTILDGGKATYSASVANIATVSGATDVFTIFGSASKTVRVLFVEIYGTAATAVAVPVSLIRRSATNTAGTSTSVTAALHDTLLNPAATSTVLSYTANPTGLGAAAGTVKNIKLYFPTTANSPSGIQYLFGGAQFPGGQGIVLRGTTQGLCVNFNSTAITTASVSMSFMFTEE